jgi:HD-GYP domain-containing protein (c-di-GMP phosphodiesterase class II)
VQVFHEGLHQAILTYEEAARYFKQALAELQTGSEEGIVAAKLVTNKLAHVLFDDQLAGSIIGLLNHPAMDERDILHAVNVSVLAMMVGQQFQLPVEDIKVLGIGALLHDLGEQQLPRELRAKSENFTDDEREAYREHPLLGVKLLSPIPAFPQEALRVIEAHHERIDGSGYPHQLREEYLSLYTKIVMVVDEYDLLVNHADPRRKMMPAEALSHLYRTARVTLSPEAIEGLVQTITVYPPGTIVELVNGAYALVLNINRQARMKPLVLLYVPHAQTHTPVIVDLMHDRARAIARRPPLSQLPSRVREYLDMERWTSYFLATAANRSGFDLAV